jgi:AraC-like DNA-binding protein
MALVSSTRIQVTGHQSDLGHWRAAQRLADPHLRDYVLGYFAREGFLPIPLHERHLPLREVAIVLNFAAPHRIIDTSDPKRTTEHRTAWIVGLQQRHHLREAFGARDFMVVRLTPIGAQMVFGVPMDLLTDRILALEEIDRRLARLLTGRTEAAHDWADRFDTVEKIIGARLTCAPSPPASLLHSWRILQEFPNHIDLARLPEELGCSRRHLIQQFRKYFGLPPKMIARMSRFHRALAAVHRVRRHSTSAYMEGKPFLDRQADDAVHGAAQTSVRWADLALACGYYDQSHFINEFKSFSGLPPSEFLQRTRDE